MLGTSPACCPALQESIDGAHYIRDKGLSNLKSNNPRHNAPLAHVLAIKKAPGGAGGF